jgi:hypothetical protein
MSADFSDERTDRIRASIEQSRAAIERVAAIERPLTAMQRVEQWSAQMPSNPRAIMRWIDQMPPLPDPEPEPPPPPPRKEAPMIHKSYSPPPVDVTAAWAEHVKQQIDAAIGNLAEVIGEETGKHEKKLRSEIAELRKQLKALGDEVAASKVTRLRHAAG